MTTLRLAFSPDSDDLFMFWPLLHGKVDTLGITFVHERGDTATLNRRSEEGVDDILAISIAQYPRVAHNYRLFRHGMSVGRGYGPVLVSKEETTADRLVGKRIGVPGLSTTAYLVLRLILPEFEPVLVPISPYRAAFDALSEKRIDAALLIHEGRLTYERESTHKVIDLGEAWSNMTSGLPLPLGGNVIKRALPESVIRNVSRLCELSIDWALSHRDTMMRELLVSETRTEVGLNSGLLDKYLEMYANQDTLSAPEDVQTAITELYTRAAKASLISQIPPLDFA